MCCKLFRKQKIILEVILNLQEEMRNKKKWEKQRSKEEPKVPED